jgi:hypothetical protein
MKHLLWPTLLAFALAGTALLAEEPLVKRHARLNGRQGAAVTCKYCHVFAGNPREGKNYARFKKGPFCALKACHRN